MARKTPKAVLELIRRHSDRQDWIQEQIDVRNNPNIPRENIIYMPEQGVSYFEGLAAGHNQMLEESLHIHNCYHGYNIVGRWENIPNPDVGTQPDKPLIRRRDIGGQVKPEQKADWRRMYYVA